MCDYMPQNRKLLLVVFSLMLLLLALPAGLAVAQGQDLAVISSPAGNSVVRGSVEITGSADYPSFQFYILEFAPEPIAGDQWKIIGEIHDKPVLNGALATWDTTSVPDGSYTIRLRVVRLDGNYSEAFAQQVTVSNAQPLPTDTPLPTPTPSGEAVPEVTGPPTATFTPLPPTPTITIDQPVVETPTPRPAVPTTPPLKDPEAEQSFVPNVTGFSFSPLRDACIYGAGLMLVIFLSFAFLSALRQIILNFMERQRRK